MFKIKVKQEILNHCRKQIKKYNFGQRGFADGTIEQQLIGIIGQSVVADIFNQSWINGESGFDDGIDIFYNGLRIDIKTMSRTTDVRDYYVNNFIGLQANYEVDVYIFTSLNKNTYELTIIGWITKEELFKKASFFPKGTIRTRSDGTTFKTFADLYEIENNKLNIVNSVDDLKQQLDEFINKKTR